MIVDQLIYVLILHYLYPSMNNFFERDAFIVSVFDCLAAQFEK